LSIRGYCFAHYPKLFSFTQLELVGWFGALKVAFVNAAPNESIEEREGRKAIASFPPLGILYLASVLEQAGIRVSVLDQSAVGYGATETLRWLKKENPDVVGFSSLVSSGRMAGFLSRGIKEINPNTVTLIGNHYATFNPERILKKYSSIDIVVRGEAEETIVDLINCLHTGVDLTRVNGIAFRKDGKTILTHERSLLRDLDLLPFPNRQLLDAEYHCVVAGVNIAPKKFTSVLSSRGCSYSCRFCNCTALGRNFWRPRSATNTLDELLQLESDGYRQLIFVDDNFTSNPKRVIELCRGMRKEKLGMEWIAEGRVDVGSLEMFSEMVAAGLRVLYFGIENANKRLLNYYNKKATPEQAEKAVRTARKAGVDIIVGSFVIGAQDETREEIQNTIDFAKRIPLDIPQFNILCAYPGNDIWNEFVGKGLLDEEKYWEIGVNVSDIAPNAVPLEEIRKMLNKAFSSYVVRPNFLFAQLARTIKSRYRLNMALNSLSQTAAIRENLQKVT
jgi:anaerobic magnesium-protoporphyrin IX monomethyl ester cyclase